MNVSAVKTVSAIEIAAVTWPLTVPTRLQGVKDLGKAILISLVLLGTLVVPCATALAAAPIVTPAVYQTPAAGGSHLCIALNAGTIAYTVTIEIVDAYSGANVATFGPSSINPGVVGSAIGGPVASGGSYCRVSGIKKSKVRVTHCALNGTNTACGPSVTVP